MSHVLINCSVQQLKELDRRAEDQGTSRAVVVQELLAQGLSAPAPKSAAKFIKSSEAESKDEEPRHLGRKVKNG